MIKWRTPNKQDRPGTGRIILACMLAKYAFALFFPLLCVLLHRKSVGYLAMAVVELALVICATELLARVKTWPAYVLNTLFLFVLNAQFAVLYWGNTFASPAMLDNLDSLQALSGKTVLYVLTAVLVFVFSLLPVRAVRWGKLPVLLGLPVALYVAAIGLGAIRYSPFCALVQTYQQMARWEGFLAAGDGVVDGSDFYRDRVEDHRARPAQLPKSPNVILIFVEGLSEHILDDPRDIAPNLRGLRERSLSFENYYNHTFATYMGLSGQLYSGYQHSNLDKNNLVSLQDIFSHYGYRTAFINTEPTNEDFSNFLAELEFDEVVNRLELSGEGYHIHDKKAYELLFDTAQELHRGDKPFLLSMYSFGTHVGRDSFDLRYGDGRDPLLNRFYNMDAQVGRFMERLAASDLAEDTLVVLTADHATYCDADFLNAFPDHTRMVPQLDKIPLMFYYQGVSPEIWDAAGRNSIDMAPTLLDFLDMTAGNYFWGQSLFAPETESWADTTFESPGCIFSTRGGEIRIPEPEERAAFEERLSRYFALKLLDEAPANELTVGTYAYAVQNQADNTLEVSIHNAEEYVEFHIAVWSEKDGQDDLKWFTARREEQGTVEYAAELTDYNTNGLYFIHIYALRAGEEEQKMIAAATATLTLPEPELSGISAGEGE